MRAFNHFGKFDVDTLRLEGLETKLSFRIRTKPAGVSRVETQALQGHHRRGRLPARRLLVLEQTKLGVKRRIFRDDDQVINRVEAEAHRVERFVVRQS